MKFVPHNYQVYCIKRIISDPVIALFLDMGLGKTAVTLTAINDLKYNRFEASKVLVIAPKRVAETTWSREAEKWDHLRYLRISKVLGTCKQRIRALNTPADVYIINRENVVWLADYYRNSWPFDMVVIDESSSFKNRQSKRFKALKLVRGRIRRLVELTGTPAPNTLIDLWAQIYLLDGGQRLGKTIGGFRERYFSPDKRSRTQIFTYKPKEDAQDAIQAAIADICVSMKAEDYLELPQLITVDVPVVLDKQSLKRYKQLEHDMLLEIDDETIDAGTAAVLSNKLLQLCNGAIYTEEHEVVEIHDCKLEAFAECIEGLNGQPVLVFYNFQHDRDRILKRLAKSGLTVKVYKGPQEEREWNSGKIDVLLAHPASTAYGLNLQDGGRNIIWYGLNWSLELYLQANARLHRQGQDRPVVVHRLIVEDSRDSDVAAALEDKDEAQERLLQSLKARIARAKGE